MQNEKINPKTNQIIKRNSAKEIKYNIKMKNLFPSILFLVSFGVLFLSSLKTSNALCEPEKTLTEPTFRYLNI